MALNGTTSGDELLLAVHQEGSANGHDKRSDFWSDALSAAILDHADLPSAVAHQIGERLGQTTAERSQFAEIARDAFFWRRPIWSRRRGRDLRGIAVHDPATTGLPPPLLNFKGYIALQAFRVSNWLWRNKRTDLALLLAKRVRRTRFK